MCGSGEKGKNRLKAHPQAGWGVKRECNSHDDDDVVDIDLDLLSHKWILIALFTLSF